MAEIVSAEEVRRRQTRKNWVVLVLLIGVALLFYAISMVKFKVS